MGEMLGECARMDPSEWTSDDPPRCWVPCCGFPGTGFTRSLGDLSAKGIGVCEVPEILVREVGPNDRFIVLCSDGVTEFLTSQDVVDIISENETMADACKDIRV